jgi:anti-sigma B factor antagonist
MTITQNFNDGQWNIAIEGRLDANTSPELEETLKAEPQELTGLTLDFGELNYISSAGLRVMLLALKQMNMAGKSIKVVNVTDPVFEVLELTGFVDILDIERA